jgi:L-serine dehydratase
MLQETVSQVERTLDCFEDPVSVTELFTIGIGPSSSHTVGPMRASLRFVERLASENKLQCVTGIRIELFGSLALTGRGHRTDIAVLLGLSGWTPETIDPDNIEQLVNAIRAGEQIRLADERTINFVEKEHLIFHFDRALPEHPNGMRFTALAGHKELIAQNYYPIGGGSIRTELASNKAFVGSNIRQPLPFTRASELLKLATDKGLSIANIVLLNEGVWREPAETLAYIDKVRDAMMATIDRGCRQKGVLPGGLNVHRRAIRLHASLCQAEKGDPLQVLDWVSLYALAVNEENAAGGRVVTAPTNGAAGVIPAVLKYYEVFCPNSSVDGRRILLLTAAAIGMLYKKRASISAAEMGCQGEIGVACSMAAGGLTAALGGTPAQIENAAEIGMEHNLGLTCDPVKGLVQIPCIERNTMGAVQAINASRLALSGDGTHVVSLDAVIETMRQTGEDMRTKYKETSLGGLAVNVVEC